MEIKNIKAYKAYDSRNKETIKVEISFNSDKVFAIAPNGTSKGKKEARDFSIKGIDYSIELVNKIGKEIIDRKIAIENFYDLEKIEEIIRKYDNSDNFMIIGGNSVYALEAALIKAFAKINEVEPWQFLAKTKPRVPRPIGNCIGGGKHIEARKKPEFQEFLIIPKTKRFFEAYFIMQQAYKKAKELLERIGKFSGMVTIENALVPLMDNEEILDLLIEVKENIKENFGITIDLGIDVAASSFYKNNVYEYKTKMQKLNASRQLSYIADLIEKYKLFYVEDPFEENDFTNFSKLRSKVNALIVGDDLTVTNPELIKHAIDKKAINAVIIKPNQVGSLIKTKQAVDIAKKNGINCVISHRSGETIDAFIADLAIAWSLPFIKAGIVGKEREAKLRRIVAIEKYLI